MPKLAEEFHKPRVKAYQIAIDAIEREWESPNISFTEHVEYKFIMKRLKKEQKDFAEKFDVEI